MSIKNNYLIPECYIQKEAYCDDCNEKLISTGITLMSFPPQVEMKCPKCNKRYNFYEKELEGEWKWRTISKKI